MYIISFIVASNAPSGHFADLNAFVFDNVICSFWIERGKFELPAKKEYNDVYTEFNYDDPAKFAKSKRMNRMC